MKLLKEDIQFPDFELTDKLKIFLTLDEVKEAFQSSNIQEVYKLYESYTHTTTLNTDITQLFFNLGINPLNYLTIIPACFSCNIDINPLILNDHIQSIGGSAFEGNFSVDSISVPSSCKVIGNYAFARCHNLLKIDLGVGVQELGDSCFFDDPKLTQITLPKSLKSINLNTFRQSNVSKLSFAGTADEFTGKLENNTLIGLFGVKITEVNCSDGVLDLKKYFKDPEIIQPDITNATGLFRIRTTNSYTLTVRKYDPKSDTFGFGWTANQGVVHSSEITFTTEKEATDFIEKANLQGDIKLGRTNKPYDLYKVNTQAGPCYLTKQYIEWLFLDTFMNNRDLNKKLPSRLIIRP